MEEKEYRLKVKSVYTEVESFFDNVDPDLVEPEQGMGTLILLTPKGKIILSMQPSVRQIWLAVAALGVAIHFNFHENTQDWRDDKGESKELISYLKTTLKKLVPELNFKNS